MLKTHYLRSCFLKFTVIVLINIWLQFTDTWSVVTPNHLVWIAGRYTLVKFALVEVVADYSDYLYVLIVILHSEVSLAPQRGKVDHHRILNYSRQNNI
jgi:hypothetical protein